jgi:hypothetical protein
MAPLPDADYAAALWTDAINLAPISGAVDSEAQQFVGTRVTAFDPIGPGGIDGYLAFMIRALQPDAIAIAVARFDGSTTPGAFFGPVGVAGATVESRVRMILGVQDRAGLPEITLKYQVEGLAEQLGLDAVQDATGGAKVGVKGRVLIAMGNNVDGADPDGLFDAGQVLMDNVCIAQNSFFGIGAPPPVLPGIQTHDDFEDANWAPTTVLGDIYPAEFFVQSGTRQGHLDMALFNCVYGPEQQADGLINGASIGGAPSWGNHSENAHGKNLTLQPIGAVNDFRYFHGPRTFDVQHTMDISLDYFTDVDGDQRVFILGSRVVPNPAFGAMGDETTDSSDWDDVDGLALVVLASRAAGVRTLGARLFSVTGSVATLAHDFGSVTINNRDWYRLRFHVRDIAGPDRVEARLRVDEDGAGNLLDGTVTFASGSQVFDTFHNTTMEKATSVIQPAFLDGGCATFQDYHWADETGVAGQAPVGEVILYVSDWQTLSPVP